MAPHTPAILVVDDDEDIRTMLTELLGNAGYEVDSASDGAAALSRLEADPTRFSLILLDLIMPHIDGYIFREIQRADPSIGHIPVVTLAASSVVGQLGLPEGIGPDNLLTKPVDTSAILALVARYCGPARE